MRRGSFLMFCAVAVLPALGDDIRVDVYPPTVHLSAANEPQRLLIVGTDEAGFTRNLTSESTFEIEADQQQIVTCQNGVLRAQRSGSASLNVAVADHRVVVPITVTGVDAKPKPVGFNRDVIPVLTRAGCNTGTCHGSARGQDKFRLSLFGYDPKGDYYRMTREQTHRRLNLALPDDSLVLLKATGAVPHSGGKRFEPNSEYYGTIRRWIEEGAANADAANAVVSRIEIFPPDLLLQGTDATQPLLVMAHYADGSQRDVTQFAVFISRDENVCDVDDTGRLHAHSRGESFVTARFDKHTVGLNTIVLPAKDSFQPISEEGNYIDQLIADKLNKLHLPVAPVCSDEEFLRRAFLDLRGLLPEEHDYHQFMNDPAADKRTALVTDLLDGEEFIDLWTQKLADLLLVRTSNVLKDKAASRYHEWLRDSIKEGVAYDDIVTELLTVSGTSFDQPATGFYVAERNKLKIAENVAQVFLGIRMQCAKCHNHPFDRWTMDDYYGFAAFFAHVGHKQGEDYRNITVFSGGGRTKHPVTGKDVQPKFLGGEQPDVKGKDRRQVAADWIVEASPYFAPTAANRIWAHFFGAGVVEPVDDVRISNPPVNRALYEALGAKLQEYDFDVRRLARDIVSRCLSAINSRRKHDG